VAAGRADSLEDHQNGAGAYVVANGAFLDAGRQQVADDLLQCR